MGEVTAYRKKHWVLELDADLASIPNPQLGDTALTLDKNKLYYKTTSGWKTGLGYEYVSRLVALPDFEVGAFTVDGAAHVNGRDLTGILPAGTIAVVLGLKIRATAADKTGTVYRDAVNVQSRVQQVSQVANLYTNEACTIVPIDTDRLMDYQFAVGIDRIQLTIQGWFI